MPATSATAIKWRITTVYATEFITFGVNNSETDRILCRIIASYADD